MTSKNGKRNVVHSTQKRADSSQSKHGGQRRNAGRREKTGNYGEDTASIRLPKRFVEPYKKLVHELSPSERRPIVDKMIASVMPSQLHPQGIRLVRPQIEEAVIRFPEFIEEKLAATFDVTADTVATNATGRAVDLNQLLINSSSASFLMEVSGDSMNQAGIDDGDLLLVQELVDSWADLRDGTIVVAFINDSHTVKRFRKRKNQYFLEPESDNLEHQPFELVEGVDEGSQWRIFGVVMHSIRRFQGQFSL